MGYRAVHLPDGNRFDRMRIDLAASFQEQDAWLESIGPRSVVRGRFKSYSHLATVAFEHKLGLREPLVNTGMRRAWFEEFRDYWEHVLEGRPLTVMDFHLLRFAYRAAAQQTSGMDWSTPERHLANWQLPENLSATFQFVYRAALIPMRSRLLLRVLRPGMRILEYGCGIAPMYRTWREFRSHIRTSWVLADIPGFPFHFARHAVGRDLEAQTHVIRDLSDPLAEVDGAFDLIVVQETFEHLDRPYELAGYLLDRLVPSGLLWFDYERTRAEGHDTPAGLRERRPTLELLAARLEPVYGDIRLDDVSLGTTVGRRRD